MTSSRSSDSHSSKESEMSFRPAFVTGLMALSALLAPSLAEAATVTVVVETVNVLEYPDPFGGYGEYQAVIKLGNVPVITSQHDASSLTFSPPSGWFNSREWDPADGAIPLEILLHDLDQGVVADQIDLNPTPGRLALTDMIPLGEQDSDTLIHYLPGNDDTGIQPTQGGGMAGAISLRVIIEGLPMPEPEPAAYWSPACLTHDDPDALDADGDGYLDGWETHGWDHDCDGELEVPLASYGANPLRKDIFLELDWIEGEEPTRDTIERVVEMFANAPVPNPDGTTGIDVHIDTGSLSDAFGPIGVDLGGGNPIPAQLLSSNDLQDLFDLRTAHMSEDHRGLFRYGISFPYGYEGGVPTPGSCRNGVDDDLDGDIDRSDTDCQPANGGVGDPINGILHVRLPPCPGTFCASGGAVLAHELGHTLSLWHGGNEVLRNCKPNHVSIMNYLYAYGIPLSDGTLAYDFSPVRIGTTRATAPLSTLFEGDLDETMVLDPGSPFPAYEIIFNNGLGQSVRSRADAPIDWDGDGSASASSVSVDIDDVRRADGDPVCDPTQQDDQHQGHDDWGAPLLYRFSAMGTFVNLPPSEPESDMPLHEAIALHEAINTTDLAIEIAPTPPTVAAGTSLAYDVRLTNTGPNPAFGTELHAVLPYGKAFFHAADSRCQASGRELLCELGKLGNGESSLQRIEIQVASSAPDGLVLTPTFTVAHEAGPDADPADNAATPSTEVVSVFDLEVRMDPGTRIALPVGENAQIQFRSTVIQHGPSGPVDLELRRFVRAKGSLEATAAGSMTIHGLAVGEARRTVHRVDVRCLEVGEFTVSAEDTAVLASGQAGAAAPASARAEARVVCTDPRASRIPRR